jgi:hypothetical protein
MDPTDLPEAPEIPAMDRRRLNSTTKLMLGVLATVGGWAVSTAATHVWNLKADTSTVEQLTHTMNRIESKLDSANFRITQLQCGKAVENGCR